MGRFDTCYQWDLEVPDLELDSKKDVQTGSPPGGYHRACHPGLMVSDRLVQSGSQTSGEVAVSLHVDKHHVHKQ